MTHVYILTEYEVYQIAYLTQHGWEADEVPSRHRGKRVASAVWRKPGKTHSVPVPHSFEFEETDAWELDDAYWEEHT